MRARVTAAIAAVAGMAVGLVVFAQARDDVDTSGPMQQLGAHGQTVQFRAGTRFTDGFEVLYLRGDTPARLLSVTSIGGDETLRQLGVLVAAPDRRLAASSLMRGFPPADAGLGTVRGLRQTLVRPKSQTPGGIGYELLIGYRVVDDGKVAARRALAVRYSVAGKEYVLTVPARLVYCPPTMSPAACQRAADRMFPEG